MAEKKPETSSCKTKSVFEVEEGKKEAFEQCRELKAQKGLETDGLVAQFVPDRSLRLIVLL